MRLWRVHVVFAGPAHLSRAGNRQINRVLHIMATVQLRNATLGRAYFDRRKAAGKTSMEAMRSLNGGCPTSSTAR
ncbi:hypothetical protein GCM10010399_64470 [Dactylosporangium fulvum]